MNVDLKTLHESKNYDEIYNLIETKFSQFESRWNRVLASEEGIKLWRNTKLSPDNRDKIYRKMFVESIVKECYESCRSQVLDKETADTNELTYNDAVGDCAIGLLQHFGMME